MTSSRILVVDDDASIRNLLHRYFLKLDYQVEVAATGSEAIEIAQGFRPHLVILDINLPDMTGFQVCQVLRKGSGLYVLMLTSRASPADRLLGFDQGADDYLTKPFNLPEVAARVAAILRRQRQSNDPAPILAITYDRLQIDPESREVIRDHKLIPLTSLEFDLLYVLAGHPGRVWRRTELIAQVWHLDPVADERVVDVHIGQIRKKLEIDTNQPEWIRTVRGVGYKFDPPLS